MHKDEMQKFRNLFQTTVREFDLLFGRCSLLCGLTMMQSHLIYEIRRQPSLSINDLAAAVGLEKSTVSRHIQRLVSMGLVSRNPGTSDRRMVTLTLTKAGKAMEAKIDRLTNDYIMTTFARIPSADLERLSSNLETVVRAMRDSTYFKQDK